MGDAEKDEIARLTRENEVLAKAVEHFRELADEGTKPLIQRMKLEDGTFDMEVTGPIVEAMAIALVGQFKEGGAKNYMEMSLYDRDEIGQRYIVTVQKAGALSPHDKATTAEARATELEDQVAALVEGLRKGVQELGAILSVKPHSREPNLATRYFEWVQRVESAHNRIRDDLDRSLLARTQPALDRQERGR